MKTTPMKLPRARVNFLSEFGIVYERCSGGTPVAVIPCHTAAQAKRIVRAARFLQMTEEEQVEKLAAVIANDEEYADNPALGLILERDARAVLKCMGLGGRGEK